MALAATEMAAAEEAARARTLSPLQLPPARVKAVTVAKIASEEEAVDQRTFLPLGIADREDSCRNSAQRSMRCSRCTRWRTRPRQRCTRPRPRRGARS